MKINRIHQIAVNVRDLDEAVNFYKDLLGANYIGRFDPPGLVFFDFSGMRLLIEKGSSKSTIYFWVNDIDSAYEELKTKGITFTTAPKLIYRDETGVFGNPSDEEWLAFFSDPSGNTLAIMSRKSGLT